MCGECGVIHMTLYNSQSIPGSCLMAGTMVLGEVSKWCMVLVGSVKTWGEEMRDDKLQGVLVNTVHAKCIVQ